MTSAEEVEVINVGLTESLDISSVHDLCAELRMALDAGTPITLDGSAVEHVDVAAVQVLISLFSYAGSIRCKLDWRRPSEELVNRTKLLGIDKYIGLDVR